MTFKECYGTEEMSFDDEMKLWKEQPHRAQTRNDKIQMIIYLDAIIEEAKMLTEAVRTFPETNEEYHAKKVHDLATEMSQIRNTFTSLYARHAYADGE